MFCLFLTLSHVSPGRTSAIKRDEVVLFFLTAASLDAAQTAWSIPVHGWVYEPEDGSVWRSLLVDELLGWLEMHRGSVNEEVFRERGRMFLVDNERGKVLVVKAAGRTFEMEPSGPEGHFEGVLRIPREEVGDPGGAPWLPFSVVSSRPEGREYRGRAQLVPPVGTSVISDLDDTIKVSEVMDKGELLTNTFLRPYRPVPGMAEVYRRWEGQGAVFHYVSASPWQLFPSLETFLHVERFPAGSFSMKHFRVKDRTFFNIFASPEETKVPVIQSFLARYPLRRFILVGDSGEKDPEIYGEIVRRYGDRVLKIFIREVPGSDLSEARFDRAFQGVDRARWMVFSDPGEIGREGDRILADFEP